MANHVSEVNMLNKEHQSYSLHSLHNLHPAKRHKHVKSHCEQSNSDRLTGNELSVADSEIALN